MFEVVHTRKQEHYVPVCYIDSSCSHFSTQLWYFLLDAFHAIGTIPNFDGLITNIKEKNTNLLKSSKKGLVLFFGLTRSLEIVMENRSW